MLAVTHLYLSLGYTQASYVHHRIYLDDYIDEIYRDLKTNLGKLISSTVRSRFHRRYRMAKYDMSGARNAMTRTNLIEVYVV